MKVEFYVFETGTQQQTLHSACQLIEKLYSSEKKLYVRMETKELAEKLDTLLWTFRDDSFLPHGMVEEGELDLPAIQIGSGDPSSKKHSQDDTIIEIVFPDPVMQQLARERFRQYRELGYDITTHKIKAPSL